MSSLVFVMTRGRTVPALRRTRRTAPACDAGLVAGVREPFLTVPLLCCRARDRFEVERLHQVERRVAQGQLMDTRPQVDDVALVAAPRGEALEDVVGQMHAEGAAARVAAVDRTGAAALRAVAAQPRRQAQEVEHARERQLPL